MPGVPTGWREGKGDAVPDPLRAEIAAKADVISPWTVGRFGRLAEAARHGAQERSPDIAWCAARGIDYLPVVFPGFSWHNMNGGPLDQIPRMGGAFLWSQSQAASRAGAKMAYMAMFDEVDEGTAIFKCTNDVPARGGSDFVTYGGRAPDRYLRLTRCGSPDDPRSDSRGFTDAGVREWDYWGKDAQETVAPAPSRPLASPPDAADQPEAGCRDAIRRPQDPLFGYVPVDGAGAYP